MSATVYEAAQHLLKELAAPSGSVNTIGQHTAGSDIIRVLVDPEYWYALGPVPSRYEGFDVRVERRGDTSQH